MGKQLNYYMTYDAFKELAQAALDSGCLILRREHTEQKQIPSADLSAVTPECSRYWFYLPELGELEYKTDTYGRYYPDHSFNQLGLSMIEAGYSKHPTDQARIYVMTGFYDEQGQWIPRSDRITKVYEKLARKARKLAQRIF